MSAPGDSGGGAGKRGLGRGLSALLGDAGPVSASAPPDTASAAGPNTVRLLPIGQVEPGPFQPRGPIDPVALDELTASVRERGVLQPILVRRHPDAPGRYQIIAGERRWRAAQAAQLHEIPALLREWSDRDAMAVALVENLQRQDLNAIEEAEGYRRLIDEFQVSQGALGDAVGKSRAHVTNTLRLLALPVPVKAMVSDGRLSAGHARALLGAAQPERLAAIVLERGLNVRQTERLVADGGAGHGRGPGGRPRLAKDSNTAALERDLTAHLGLKVEIAFDGKGGSVRIFYRDLEQLDGLVQLLSSSAPKRRG